jgi:hypothetical protein
MQVMVTFSLRIAAQMPFLMGKERSAPVSLLCLIVMIWGAVAGAECGEGAGSVGGG